MASQIACQHGKGMHEQSRHLGKDQSHGRVWLTAISVTAPTFPLQWTLVPKRMPRALCFCLTRMRSPEPLRYPSQTPTH